MRHISRPCIYTAIARDQHQRCSLLFQLPGTVFQQPAGQALIAEIRVCANAADAACLYGSVEHFESIVEDADLGYRFTFVEDRIRASATRGFIASQDLLLVDGSRNFK